MSNLSKAFKALRKEGYFARQNFMCCQGCGWSAVPEGREEKVVFFHSQDAARMRDGNEFYLAWSGDGNEICRVLNENGVETKWDGSNSSRIAVTSWEKYF
jgi:hypothetical protein